MKLYYRMNKYPSNKDGDEYIELLAQGGYMIGAIASLLFPETILVDEPLHPTLQIESGCTIMEVVRSGRASAQYRQDPHLWGDPPTLTE